MAATDPDGALASEELLKKLTMRPLKALCSAHSVDHGLTGVEMLPNTPDAVARAVVASIAKHGDAAVAAIPEGPYVIPFSRAA